MLYNVCNNTLDNITPILCATNDYVDGSVIQRCAIWHIMIYLVHKNEFVNIMHIQVRKLFRPSRLHTLWSYIFYGQQWEV